MIWYYVPHDYELGVLDQLVRRGRAANRHVDYAGNYGRCSPAAEFRFDDEIRRVSPESDGEPPVLGVQSARPVEVRVGAGDWRPAVAIEGAADEPPHRALEPVSVEPLTVTDGLWCTPAPVLGRLVFRCAATPVVVSGESREEALADPATAETRHEVIRQPDGSWATVHELGFRFARIDAPGVSDVRVEARRHPVVRRGSFSCSDPTLTRIWSVSAETLHLCMQGLMIDGIKRDRMPWMGDQALNTLSNAYAFGDSAIARAGLIALGSPSEGYVNGIADYSLWWLINTAFLAMTSDASAYLRAEGDHIHAFTERLADDAGEDGLFRPTPTGEDFLKPVFIDWGVDTPADRVSTALQVLWYWALTSAADVLGTIGHHGAERWRELAQRVATTLHSSARDGGLWREFVDSESAVSVYPAFLAVLAGLDNGDTIREQLTTTARVGTPFMTGFLLLALVRLGESATAVERIREHWGGMLRAGASTFWEEFADPDRSPYEMYGRPFGKSLCHAWASGPAALLPDAIVGLRPLADGWTRFAVAPQLGTLDWAHATVPAPQGDISVQVRGRLVRVEVPAGAVLVTSSSEHAGPAVVEWQL